MKNKNIKNKPKNEVDGISCILDFPKISGGGPPDPLIKGIQQLNPQNLSSTTATKDKKTKQTNKKKKKKKKPESPPPLKQSTRNVSLGYTEIEKRKKGEGAGARFFCVCDL